MAYMSTAEKAQKIRDACKARGWNRRAVSVRVTPGGSLRVEVLSASVPLSVVRTIAKEQEHVRYCEASGEILSGGNTFVDASYSTAALVPLVAEIDAALQTVEATPGVHVEVRGMISWRCTADDRNWYARVEGECLSREIRCYGREYCADMMAARIADRDALAALAQAAAS